MEFVLTLNKLIYFSPTFTSKLASLENRYACLSPPDFLYFGFSMLTICFLQGNINYVLTLENGAWFKTDSDLLDKFPQHIYSRMEGEIALYLYKNL